MRYASAYGKRRLMVWTIITREYVSQFVWTRVDVSWLIAQVVWCWLLQSSCMPSFAFVCEWPINCNCILSLINQPNRIQWTYWSRLCSGRNDIVWGYWAWLHYRQVWDPLWWQKGDTVAGKITRHHREITCHQFVVCDCSTLYGVNSVIFLLPTDHADL